MGVKSLVLDYRQNEISAANRRSIIVNVKILLGPRDYNKIYNNYKK